MQVYKIEVECTGVLLFNFLWFSFVLYILIGLITGQELDFPFN